MILIFFRPKGMNEATAATIGAVLIFISGSVSLADVADIGSKVTGAALTIIATMVMALTMESIGFFHWAATRLLIAAKGSGIRLFWLTNLLCFLMTLFLNNDGSIIITTPVLLMLFRKIGLKQKEKFPYLISGALIATASSVPIGVSNIVNLISLNMIGLDLYMQTAMMFIPGIVGLAFLYFILLGVFYRHLPKKIPLIKNNIDYRKIPSLHPLHSEPNVEDLKRQSKLMVGVFAFIFLVRIALFVASYYDIPISIVAVSSSVLLLGWRWFYLKINPSDMVKKTPWDIFVFAYAMYIVVYGLHNIGLTNFLVQHLEPIMDDHLFKVSLIMGSILTLMSNVFNNHPALMIGTFTLTEMNLEPIVLQTLYLANIIGSDIGALLIPTGTLATLIWMHILKQHNVKVSWGNYMKVTLIVIPATVIFSIVILYIWLDLFFY
ncbi:arsenic transporter [Bacillus sp. B1-b2]|nr:arsenic transporter [Bacillus sp. B1-b2]